MLYNLCMTATTRERILETISQLRTATVAELSRQLHTTAANIRYHLDFLLAEEIIEPLPPNPDNPQRGRPAMQYRLSQKASPNDLAQLGNDLLTTLLTVNLPTEPGEKLHLLACERIRDVHLNGSATQQLTQAIEFLNHHAYQARWEARRFGPEIRFGNCPFHAILSDHPEICEIDRQMLELMLDARVRLLESMREAGEGMHGCLFSLQFLAQSAGKSPQRKAECD